MNFLLVNDDGIDSIGLHALIKEFSNFGNVYVVAPNTQKSSSSHALTLSGKIQYEERNIQYATKAYALWGSPADCTHIGFSILIDKKIDMVISGINRGANASTDIIYSGTIAAAREAFLHGFPAVSSSLDSYTDDNYDLAAYYTREIALKYYNAHDYSYFININVPAVQKKDIKGILVCDKSSKIIHHDKYIFGIEYDFNYVELNGHKAEMIYDENDLRIDLVGLKNNYVTVSPLYDNHFDVDSVSKLEKTINNSF